MVVAILVAELPELRPVCQELAALALGRAAS